MSSKKTYDPWIYIDCKWCKQPDVGRLSFLSGSEPFGSCSILCPKCGKTTWLHFRGSKKHRISK